MTIHDFIEKGNFTHHYQPIYNIQSNSVIGYEGLLRSEKYPNPEHAFLEAREKNSLFELDSCSLQKAIFTYQSAGYSIDNGLLFLNIIPSTLENKDFFDFVNKIMKENQGQQIVLEISETEEMTVSSEMIRKLEKLRGLGIRIAVDDFGKSYSHFKTIIEMGPEFIKLDRYLTADLSSSLKKQAIIQYCLDFCSQFNSKLILEGIETELELEMAKQLGVIYAQGFFLGRPAILPKAYQQVVV
jgi:EAL domain-containing protein (putative c-di-GMP-specific phosphodiesterase class I)